MKSTDASANPAKAAHAPLQVIRKYFQTQPWVSTRSGVAREVECALEQAGRFDIKTVTPESNIYIQMCGIN